MNTKSKIIIFKQLFLILFIFCFETSYSQTWKFIGGPIGVLGCKDILFTKTGRLICSTENQLLFSDDFGDNWKVAQGYSGYEITSFLQRRNGEILASSSQGLIKSTDQGENWVLIGTEGRSICESPKDFSLYYTDGNNIFKSLDGGLNWKNIWSTDTLGGIAITDSGWIYGGSRYGQLLRSKNNGVTFEKIDIGYAQSVSGYDITNAIIYDLIPDKNNSVYFKIYNPSIWGEEIIHYLPKQEYGLYYICSAYSQPLLGVTGEGNLLYINNYNINEFKVSSERSRSFFPLNEGTIQTAKKIVVYGDTWIISFGRLGTFRSFDKGMTWQEIGLGYKSCTSILINAQENLYVGTFSAYFWGGLYESVDFGKTWENLNPLNTGAYINNIHLSKKNNLIASGSYGVFISNGKWWAHSLNVSLVYSQYVSSNGTIYINTVDSIYVSEDEGLNWYSTNLDPGSQCDGNFGESITGRVFIGGWQSPIFYTDNNGKNWNKVNSHLFNFNSINDFAYKNDTVFVASSQGLLYSIDNGITWFKDFYLNEYLKKIVISSAGDIVVATYDNIYYKKNGSQIWEESSEGLNNNSIYDMKFDVTNRLYLSTIEGIYYTEEFSKGPNSGVEDFSIQQNFPNPFNATTNILFNILFDTKVSIKVYNTIGQEIETLIDKELVKGYYQYKWDATGFASGVYIIQISTSNYVKSIKTLLLK